MFIGGFIREREFCVAICVLTVLILIAALVSLIVGVELSPSGRYQMPRTGSYTDLRGTQAGSKPWPSRTPHKEAWPAPHSWERAHLRGMWHFDVRGRRAADPENSDFIMDLWQTGWPLPVIERKHMWWDWDNPALEGPAPDPAAEILYFGLFLNTLILGGGLWLLVFGPLAGWVIGRRFARTLRGQCTFCGYDIAGLKRCPECGWAPKMRMVQEDSGALAEK